MIIRPDRDDGPDGYALNRSGLFVPEHLIEPAPPIGIDLFAGCGGMSCGMHQGGFHVIAALELEFNAAVTYIIRVYPQSLSKDELAERVGVSPTSGGYFNNLGSLRSLGLITYPRPAEAAAQPVLFLEA